MYVVQCTYRVDCVRRVQARVLQLSSTHFIALHNYSACVLGVLSYADCTRSKFCYNSQYNSWVMQCHSLIFEHRQK